MKRIQFKFVDNIKCQQLSNVHIIQLLNMPCFTSRLISLSFDHCSFITDESIIVLSQQCYNLHSLNLTESALITDASIISISCNCTDLTSLDLSFCKLTNILY